MAVQGYTRLTITIGTKHIQHNFVVVRAPKYPGHVLLGNPFLVQADIILYPAQNSISMDGTTFFLEDCSRL